MSTVCAPKPARQLREQRPCHGRALLHTPAEILSPQHEEGTLFHGNHVRRTGLVVDEGELADVFPHAQNAQDHLATVFRDEHHLDTSGTHDEEAVAGVVLEQDDTPLGITLLAHEFAELGEFGGVERLEKGDRGEEGRSHEVGC